MAPMASRTHWQLASNVNVIAVPPSQRAISLLDSGVAKSSPRQRKCELAGHGRPWFLY